MGTGAESGGRAALAAFLAPCIQRSAGGRQRLRSPTGGPLDVAREARPLISSLRAAAEDFEMIGPGERRVVPASRSTDLRGEKIQPRIQPDPHYCLPLSTAPNAGSSNMVLCNRLSVLKFFRLSLLVTLWAISTATGQYAGAQNSDAQTAQPQPQPAAKQSLADHPLVGWWLLDAEKTAEDLATVVEDPALRERMFRNSTMFHFNFRDSGDCTILLGRIGEGTWSEKAREPQQGEIKIVVGNGPMGFKYVLSDPDHVSMQPDRQPFRIFLRRLQAPTTDPERLSALTAQLTGTWRVSAEKTKALQTARKFPSNPDTEAMFEDMSWELKENLLQPSKETGPSLTLSPLVAEVDDWQAKNWNGVILGKTNLGTSYGWECRQGESILVIEGMPVVVERSQTSR